MKGESWPGAFCAESQNHIQGELYKLAKPAETLKKLDRIEGCREGLFIRKVVDVWTGSSKVKVWAYFCDRP